MLTLPNVMLAWVSHSSHNERAQKGVKRAKDADGGGDGCRPIIRMTHRCLRCLEGIERIFTVTRSLSKDDFAGQSVPQLSGIGVEWEI